MCLLGFNTTPLIHKTRFERAHNKKKMSWTAQGRESWDRKGKDNGLNCRSKRFNYTNFHKMLKYQMTSKTQLDTLTLRKYKSTVCLSVRRDNIRPSDAAARGSVATASGGVRATSSVSAAQTCKIRNSVWATSASEIKTKKWKQEAAKPRLLHDNTVCM